MQNSANDLNMEKVEDIFSFMEFITFPTACKVSRQKLELKWHCSTLNQCVGTNHPNVDEQMPKIVLECCRVFQVENKDVSCKCQSINKHDKFSDQKSPIKRQKNAGIF